jgi:hypothetical protein
MATTWVQGRLWLIYLAAGLATAAGSLLLPDLPHSIVYDLVGLSAVVAILCGVRLQGLVRRGMWYGLGGC